MKNIYITGGAGCIGTALSKKLYKNKNYQIHIIDNLSRGIESKHNLTNLLKTCPNIIFYKLNILNYSGLKKIIKNPYVIFHLAALPSHRLSLKNPLAYAKTDLLGTVNILEILRLYSNKAKIIFASTNKVYGKQNPPFVESSQTDPQGPYGLAKLQSEQWLQLYHQFYGINAIVARLFHVTGPRTQPDREISIFTQKIIENKTVNVHGIYKNNKFISCSAGYTNVYDVADGLILLMEKANGFDIYNIGSRKETPVLNLATYIAKSLSKKTNIKFVQMLDHESLRHSADNSKIKKIGWVQKYTVQDSLNQFLKWQQKLPFKRKTHYK